MKRRVRSLPLELCDLDPALTLNFSIAALVQFHPVPPLMRLLGCA